MRVCVSNRREQMNDLVFSLQTPDSKIMIESEIPQNKKQWLERLETAISTELSERDYADNEGEKRKKKKK